MIPNTNEIQAVIHCGKCLDEFKTSVPESIGHSPQTFAKLTIGWTERGFQIWCNRHNVNVMHVDFEGVQHPANTMADVVHAPECPAARDDDAPEGELQCTCGGRDE